MTPTLETKSDAVGVALRADAIRHGVAPSNSLDVWRGRTARSISFGSLVGLTLALFWVPLKTLAWFAFHQELYSHIALVPLVSASFFFLDRKRIFSDVETRWGAGGGLLVAGALFYGVGRAYSRSRSENDQLSVSILTVVVLWVGCFLLCYGIRAFRKGLFPALFLILMVPIPDLFLSRAIFWLQTGSAELVHGLFELVGVPIFRAGFVFSLPGVTIEIAKECSGIRSSVAFLIMSLLAGHLFLRSAWTKGVLVLATLPLLLVKNAIRIVSLTLLSIYVDPRFLTGRLHQNGGILFFLLALVLLTPVLGLLQRLERTQEEARNSGVSPHA